MAHPLCLDQDLYAFGTAAATQYLWNSRQPQTLQSSQTVPHIFSMNLNPVHDAFGTINPWNIYQQQQQQPYNHSVVHSYQQPVPYYQKPIEDEYEPSTKRSRLPIGLVEQEIQTVIVRRQCISKKNAKRLKRLKHLRNFFTSSYQRSAVDPSSWCFHFWLETLREIKLSQSGFERVTAKLRHISQFMTQAIQQLSNEYSIDVYMLLAAVISIPFVAETELTVERSFVTFCDLIEDILKINGILESELNERHHHGLVPDLKANIKPKKAKLSILVNALFNIINEFDLNQQQSYSNVLSTPGQNRDHLQRSYLYPYGYV
ncbi:hypothetical protein ACOME3_000165 [Neoechinorhynchus agilis]